MKLRTALLAATMLAVPALAGGAAQAAQPVSGLYVSLGAGINFKQDLSGTATAAGGSGSGNLESQIGPAFAAAVGWGFGNGFRAEVEGNYYNNKFDKVTGAALPGSAGGREQLFGAMLNGYYDFNMVPYVTPYVGVGVGYEEANWQGGRASFAGVTATIPNATEGGFAAQAILGAALPLTAVPGLDLTAEYRFLAVLTDRTYSGSVGAIPISVKAHNDYNHTFLIGLRYAFGAAPAAPAPMAAPMAAPAPAPARSYIVFFDWDKATLTTRARQIIHEAAASSTHVQYTQIAVNGYTDTSGTAKYNMGLSIRRANAVAGELVRDGVPRNAIVIRGFGETHPLVPTGPNVREPQNRRVEIIIR
ncbi:MAG: OmpA family protein [Rhodospirillales bacterium]|nr:OmpA family protein [Rhodospirillales bacterium]